MIIAFDVQTTTQREGNPIYDASIIFLAGICLFVALVLAFYAFRLYHLMKNSSIYDSKTTNWPLIRFTLLAIIFLICFADRVFFFCYRLITGQTLPNTTYIILSYYLPELIPSFLQLWLVRSTKRQQSRQRQYIETLYDEDEADHLTTPNGVTLL